MRKIENQNKEFKQAWNENCLKTICAFSNTAGGKLYIGVDDAGKSVGVNDAARYLDEIPNKTKDILGITPKVSVKKKAGKEIIEVSVDYSSAPISYHGRFYTRSGSSSIEIKGHELSDLLMAKSGRSWDGFIEEQAGLKDIDVATIRKFKTLAAKRIPLIAGEKSAKAVLHKLNLLEKGKLRRAAILLFGKDPKKFYITSYIKIGKFANETDIVSTDDIEGNLFQQVEKAMDILRVKYLVSNITYEGIYRKDTLEYPEDALREAVINAVIHRSYMGAHTQLKVYPDRLNLWNIGGLPASIRIDDLKKWHSSKPRNDFLADVFFKAGMIEAWGRGTIKIIDECKNAGLPEPEFREEFGGFSVAFRKERLGEKVGEKVGGKVGGKVGERLSINQRKIVKFIIKKPAISAKELSRLIGISQRKIEENIAKLKVMGILKRIGPDKGGEWRVNGQD